MNIIKFKVWNATDKTMEILNLTSYLGGSVGLLYSSENIESLDWLMYTGVKDKNGIEIYNKDVVKLPSGLKYKVTYSEHGEWCVGNRLLSQVYEAVEVLGSSYNLG